MDVEARQKIQARIRELDDWLRDLEAREMTEGGLSCGPDTEADELCRERQQLLEELAEVV